MKREVIRAEMAEDVIQKVLLLRKNMRSHTVSTQDVIEDASQHSVQLYVMISALVQDVIQRETRLKMCRQMTDVCQDHVTYYDTEGLQLLF